MADWQPIETAPRDTVVLVSSPTSGIVMVYTERTGLGYPTAVIAKNNSLGGYGLPFLHSGHYIGDATHWQPLPDPPK